MEIITPDKTKFLLPAGSREIRVAEHQRQYETLPSLITPDGKVASQWLPNAGELAMLNAGVPVTLVIYTFNRTACPQCGLLLGLMPPVCLMVGGADLT